MLGTQIDVLLLRLRTLLYFYFFEGNLFLLLNVMMKIGSLWLYVFNQSSNSTLASTNTGRGSCSYFFSVICNNWGEKEKTLFYISLTLLKVRGFGVIFGKPWRALVILPWFKNQLPKGAGLWQGYCTKIKKKKTKKTCILIRSFHRTFFLDLEFYPLHFGLWILENFWDAVQA